MDKFVAITGDIAGSRRASDRQNLQDRLNLTLQKINTDFKAELAVPFNITIGDEFQGLLTSLSKSLDCILEMEKGLYPFKARFGVGTGSISTAIAQTTAQMDGECFYLSRKAIEEAKKQKRAVIFKTQDEKLDQVVNTILMLMDAIKSDWKDIHYRRFWLYEELGSIEKVAQKEGVNVRAVWESLKRSKYEAIIEAQKMIRVFIASIN